MIPAVVAPAFLQPSALVFTFLLPLGGILSIWAKPRGPIYAAAS